MMTMFEQFIMTGLLLAHAHSCSERLRRCEMPISPRDVKRAIDYMESNLDAPLTLSDIVGAAGVPPHPVQALRGLEGRFAYALPAQCAFPAGARRAETWAGGNQRHQDRQALRIQSHEPFFGRISQALRGEPFKNARTTLPPARRLIPASFGVGDRRRRTRVGHHDACHRRRPFLPMLFSNRGS